MTRLKAEPRKRDDAGFTLVEIVVVLFVLAIVLPLCFDFLISAQNAASKSDARSQNNDEARTAVQGIDRLVRSGNVLYSPGQAENTNAGVPSAAYSASPAAGFAMRVYTQSNGAQRCVQWRVISGALQSRGWRPDWASDPLAATDGAVSGWRTVATSVVNTSTFPFTLDPAPSFGGRLIQLDIQVNKNSRLGATAEVQASVAGRNTEYYNTSQTTCSPVPTP